MPAEGQTCSNCAGDCCSIVSFANTRDIGRSFSMDITYTDLRARGYEEILRPHTPCAYKTSDACSIYETRPLLCRTYYSHGKLWRPK
jgi:Fe-S-cluster containining protein